MTKTTDNHPLSEEGKNTCPEFPYFGATYPDARCIDGYLFDMDKCDDEGNLYSMSENYPCPFCNFKAFLSHNGPYTKAEKTFLLERIEELKIKYK